MKTYKDIYKGETKALQAFCESITDCHHSTPEYFDSGKLVVRNFNIKNGRMLLDSLSFTNELQFEQRTSRAKPEPGDLIITREAPMGEVCIIPEGVECCLGQRMVLIKPDVEKVDRKFLLYALLSQYSQKQIQQSNGTGSIVSNLRIPTLKELQIPEIPIFNQRKIGEILGSIDEKIELNNKINAELEAMAKLIYDYWFVQFDFPDANGKPYKSSGGKMVYNEELQREIPEGWCANKLGALLHTELGGTPSTKVSEYWQGDTPWLDSGEVANFPIIESEKYISQEAIKKSATTLMPKGTCTLSITRHLRPSILAVDACANQSVVGIFESEALLNLYIYPYLQNEIPRFMSLRTGAQQPHINKGIVDSSLMVVPETRVLSLYYKKVASLYEKIYNNAFENKQLQNLRNWLLPMLMNGQVTINKS